MAGEKVGIRKVVGTRARKLSIAATMGHLRPLPIGAFLSCKLAPRRTSHFIHDSFLVLQDEDRPNIFNPILLPGSYNYLSLLIAYCSKTVIVGSRTSKPKLDSIQYPHNRVHSLQQSIVHSDTHHAPVIPHRTQVAVGSDTT